MDKTQASQIVSLKSSLRPLLSSEDLQKHLKKRANRSLSKEREDFEKQIIKSIIQEVLKWFELILNEKIQDYSSEDEMQFFEKIKDGVILCNILTQVNGKLNKEVNLSYNKTPKTPANMVDNIAIFLQGLESLGVKVIFNALDLYDLKNIKIITSTLHAFGIQCNRLSFSPPFQTKYSDLPTKISDLLNPDLQIVDSPSSTEDTTTTTPSVDSSSGGNGGDNLPIPSRAPPPPPADDDNGGGGSDDTNLVDTLIDLLQFVTNEEEVMSGGGGNNNNNDDGEENEDEEEEDEDDEDEEESDDYDESDVEVDDDDEKDDVLIHTLLEIQEERKLSQDAESSPTSSSNNNNNDDTTSSGSGGSNQVTRTSSKSKPSTSKNPKLRNLSLDNPPSIEEMITEITRLRSDLKREKKLRMQAEIRAKKYRDRCKQLTSTSSSSSDRPSTPPSEGGIDASKSPKLRTRLQDSTDRSRSTSALPIKSQAAKMKLIKGTTSKLKRISTHVNASELNLLDAHSTSASEELKEQRERKELIRKAKEDQLKSKLSSREQRLRLNVLLEIVNTEKDYVEDLKVITRARSGLLQDKVITPDQAQTIFSNIQQILGIHEEMCKGFEDRMEAASDELCWNCSIGDIMLKYTDFFKMYTIYVGNQNAQNQMSDQFLHHSKSFVNSLLKHCPEFESRAVILVSFHSALIKPIQRICKYPLLLKELLKYTEEEHVDRGDLDRSYSQLLSITTFINQKKKESEELLKLLEIQEAIADLPKNFSIAVPGRQFIREANLIKISKGKAQERHFYLFNDIIVYGAKPIIKTANSRLTFKGKILLQMLLVNDLPDTPERKYTFEIVRLDHKKKKYIICAKEMAEKKEWMNDIADLVNGYLAEDLRLKNNPLPLEEKGSLQLIRELSEELDALEIVDTSSFDGKAISEHNAKVSELQERLTTLKKTLGTDSASQIANSG